MGALREMGNCHQQAPEEAASDDLEGVLDNDVALISEAAKVSVKVQNADGDEVCDGGTTDHSQCDLAQVPARVLPSELVRTSLKRELKASWGRGELELLWYGGMAVNVDGKRWEELGVEDGAILKARWRNYAFLTDDTIRGAVEKWCNLSTREQARSEYGGIAEWDVSRVTNMSFMFLHQGDFNEDISGWDVANVANMKSMFFHASSFNQRLGAWNVANVTNMEGMFRGASSFNQPLEAWNVANVTSMYGMFNGASSFNQPLGAWNVSNGTDMADMFNGTGYGFFNRAPTWKR